MQFIYCSVLFVCHSRVTRSLAMAKTARHRQCFTASSRPHHAPYWMRHCRAATGDTDASDTVSNVIGLLQSRDCGVELETSSPSAQKLQVCDNCCMSSRSSRLAGCTKSSEGKKALVVSETCSRLLESNSTEGHLSACCTSMHNAHHRLHCGSATAAEACLCPHHSAADSAAVITGPADCGHSPCSKMSANTHADRPWVSTV